MDQPRDEDFVCNMIPTHTPNIFLRRSMGSGYVKCEVFGNIMIGKTQHHESKKPTTGPDRVGIYSLPWRKSEVFTKNLGPA